MAARPDPSALCAIYERISDDREGRELGVDRQDEDDRKLAARLGLGVFRVYRDNDIGASTRTGGKRRRPKNRPDYDAMLADARAGKFGTIISYTSSRLTRRPREHEGQIELAEDFGIRYAFVASPSFDLNTAAGRRIARILAATDAGESEETSERVTRAREARVKSGGNGGGPRGYGFASDGATHVPEEADVIRWATLAAVAGATLCGLCADLNRAGVPTTMGAVWHSPTLRRILIRPRNAGFVVHDGAIVINDNGQSMRMPGVPIVSEDEWLAVVALLTDQSRSIKPGRPPSWLGSGLYRCHCGSIVRVRAGKRPAVYRCKEKRPGVDGHVMRSVRQADELVRAAVVERLRRPDAAALFEPPAADVGIDAPALRAERVALRAEIANTETAVAEGLSVLSAARMVRHIEARLAEIGAELATLTARSPVSPMLGVDDPAAVWDSLGLTEQRMIVDLLMVVTLLPSGSCNRFQPESVSIMWRSD